MVDFVEFSGQLRKPSGIGAKQVTNFMAKANMQMYDFVLSKINFFSGMKILELGMADGFFVNKFFGLESDIAYVGVDYSTDMVDEAKKLNEELRKIHDIQFKEGNISALEIYNNAFDTFLTINTHYFWENLSEGISEMLRVVKPKGQFIICGRTMESMKLLPFTQCGFAHYSNETLQEHFDISKIADFKFETFTEKITLPNGEQTELVNFCAFGIKV